MSLWSDASSPASPEEIAEILDCRLDRGHSIESASYAIKKMFLRHDFDQFLDSILRRCRSEGGP